MNRKLAIGLLMLCFAVANAPSAKGSDWPSVVPWHAKVSVADVNNAAFERYIVSGKDRRNLYRLSCHPGGYDGEEGKYAFSGLIDCWLESLSKDDPDSLLRDKIRQTAYWETRGRFLDAHLEGACGTYSDWGKSRRFRVRGMEIEIRIENVKMARERSISSYDLAVSVKNDAAAVRAISAAPETPQPAWFYSAEKHCSAASPATD